MQVKLWIGRKCSLGIEKKGKIGKSCGNKGCARSLAASNKKVPAATVYGEEIKRLTRLPCPAQTDPPWTFV